MEFMLLLKVREGAPICAPGEQAEMKEFIGTLVGQGCFRRGAPLRGGGTTLRVRDGKAVVSDGPFAEAKEVVGGFVIVEVASRAEAIDLARRCPHARYGPIEVHALRSRHTYRHADTGRPVLYIFRMEPGLTDPDGAKLREMVDFGEGLARKGKLVETAPLDTNPRPARVERRDATMLVTDGPFAESKEGVGGYGLVLTDDPDDAMAIARRYPHAMWGPVEVREIDQ